MDLLTKIRKNRTLNFTCIKWRNLPQIWKLKKRFSSISDVVESTRSKNCSTFKISHIFLGMKWVRRGGGRGRWRRPQGPRQTGRWSWRCWTPRTDTRSWAGTPPPLWMIHPKYKLSDQEPPFRRYFIFFAFLGTILNYFRLTYYFVEDNVFSVR